MRIPVHVRLCLRENHCSKKVEEFRKKKKDLRKKNSRDNVQNIWLIEHTNLSISIFTYLKGRKFCSTHLVTFSCNITSSHSSIELSYQWNQFSYHNRNIVSKSHTLSYLRRYIYINIYLCLSSTMQLYLALQVFKRCELRATNTVYIDKRAL